MWTCSNCQSENEDSFKFCWNCGQTKTVAEAVSEPLPADEPRAVEAAVEPETVPTAAPAERPAPVRTAPEAPPAVKAESFEPVIDHEPQVRPLNPAHPAQPEDDDVLPMLKRVAGVNEKRMASDDDISLERKVFTIAVRLVGLYLLYRVLLTVPDLAAIIYSLLLEDRPAGVELRSVFFSTLFRPLATALFYLVVGVYLIASGNILLWLLPRR